MIEMQWVTSLLQDPIEVGSFEELGGKRLKLQFREVFKDPYSKFETATEWQNVKIGDTHER